MNRRAAARRLASRVATVAVAIALVALAGCARTTPISQITQQGTAMRGKHVEIAGEVVDRVDLPLLHKRYYHVDDGTGRLWVLTEQTPPQRGARVEVSGELQPGLRIPGIDVGLVLEEKTRQ